MDVPPDDSLTPVDVSVRWVFMISRKDKASASPALHTTKDAVIKLARAKELDRLVAERTAELQEREAHYRLLFEAESDAILLIDNKTGRILEANPAASSLYGYSHAELLRLRNVDLSAEPRQTRRVTVKTPLDYNKRVEVPLRYHRKKDGSVFAVEMAGRFFLRLGRPVHVVAIRDVTDRVRMDHVLRQKQEELKAIHDNVPQLLCTIDRSRRILFANRAFIEFCGLEADQVLNGRACGIFGCINAALSRQGCGYARKCRDCRIFQAIKDTFKTGREHRCELYQGTLKRNGRLREVALLGATALVEAGAYPKVLLSLEDITELAQAHKDLEQSRSALRALLDRMERSREEVRANISREIHDVLGQNLTGIKMDLRWLERTLGKPGVRRETLTRRLTEAVEMLDKTTVTVQQLASELRPSEIEYVGISASLQDEARRFQARTGIRCSLRVPRRIVVMETYAATALFRIFQECMTNISRHANATHVKAELTCVKNASILRVADNGKGIPEPAITDPHSLGLLGMRERVVTLGGDLEIRRREQGGTIVTARIPLDGKRKEE